MATKQEILKKKILRAEEELQDLSILYEQHSNRCRSLQDQISKLRTELEVANDECDKTRDALFNMVQRLRPDSTNE